MNRKGFTMIEMLVVLVIMGILAGLAVNGYSQSIKAAKIAGMKSDLKDLVTAEQAFFTLHDDTLYTTKLSDMHYIASPGDSITVALTADGWQATIIRAVGPSATDDIPGAICAVFIGSTGAAPATRPGSVACAIPPTT